MAQAEFDKLDKEIQQLNKKSALRVHVHEVTVKPSIIQKTIEKASSPNDESSKDHISKSFRFLPMGLDMQIQDSDYDGENSLPKPVNYNKTTKLKPITPQDKKRNDEDN